MGCCGMTNLALDIEYLPIYTMSLDIGYLPELSQPDGMYIPSAYESLDTWPNRGTEALKVAPHIFKKIEPIWKEFLLRGVFELTNISVRRFFV